jgi:protoporphyrinogen oxidase
MTDGDVTGHGPRVVVIGAGPAGLTAALELVRRGARPVVLESDDVVGGISRTVERDGWRFDIGGHRFFTKVPEVERLWHEILPPEDFLTRPRLSRIYYDGKLFDYPLRAGNALRGLGLVESIRCVASYLKARLRPPADQSTFEDWVVARFGWRLYRTFFKTYTEKVWGVSATLIQADWAAQRIKNMSLATAVVRALLPKRNRTDVTSLIEQFEYPKYGPGMMWERCRELVERAGGTVVTRATVTSIERSGGRAVAVHAVVDGEPHRFACDHVVSSMPLGSLVLALDADEVAVETAARSLRHRDFLTVALVVPHDAGFPDNWIYVHSPEVRVGRIQNFGSWSPYMVKDGRTCLGLEYFVNVGDDLWTTPDDELVAFATRELEQLGLVEPGRVEAGYAVRMPKAYPVYDAAYRDNVEAIAKWLAAEAPNVYPVGRNGMHRYNNQDHSMLTAVLSVENIYGADHDVWSVNVDDEYHEEARRPSSSANSSQTSPSTTAARSSAPGTGRDAPLLPLPYDEPEPADRVVADQASLAP